MTRSLKLSCTRQQRSQMQQLCLHQTRQQSGIITNMIVHSLYNKTSRHFQAEQSVSETQNCEGRSDNLNASRLLTHTLYNKYNSDIRFLPIETLTAHETSQHEISICIQRII